ncbi:MAG: hypothetical protein KIH01_04925 [Candidatus Freyarchaeota archaeon]|nr:hypothetical protein [Candidatus Jordarchaeia archaeon]
MRERMIHALLLIGEDGVGRVAYDDGMGIEYTLFSGMVHALNRFFTEIFGKRQWYREVEVPPYTLTMVETLRGLWVCIHDSTDNSDLIYYKVSTAVRLLERNCDFSQNLKTSVLPIDEKTKEVLVRLLSPEGVPKGITQLLNQKLRQIASRQINVTIHNAYLLSMERGVIASWEPEKKPDIKIRQACFNMLRSLPNTPNVRLSLSSREKRGVEEWRLKRIGNSSLFVFVRASMGEGARGLFELLFDRMVASLEQAVVSTPLVREFTPERYDLP